ncbi:MAG TPA: orotate phosphoribosyltransferase [Elusimicrobia bacterium]|nr:MAG: orotate phosphoribosyltransferase [Elusimicrobia bacterium RIFOXYA12_FULL_49_49]OGS09527.1 MAG: orotate phosphoribosyltransferase [Elusimicrobia bacterium RIFOXYA1_FULL_47_7]OGS15488.1 MAG: orotate phosphoribosyltransferase [Elusimicrobia bacterium RIFOXYA2_FULL_47_53]OGS26983.1 MAG: orotate phosphoribosyltransferase [Elusimicrobia bacterium RIFOXYB12_FULL_50_12]OGS30928.1 MAG: orotate phosphoribosyltransferase [Elusimicrobia bacterium RIFOXYB2_FULL_46_23]HBU70114.1 orotate phosphoribo
MSNDLRKLFEEKKALLNGHFLLSSGLHSDTYFQSALILQYPDTAEKLAQELRKLISGKLGADAIDLVISPAMGGIVIGQEVGRALGRRAIFCERVEGKLVLRRGFKIEKGEKCVVVEDVITTGLSTGEVVEVVKSLGGDVVAVASLVDRSGGKVDFGVPRFSLLSLEVKSYKPEECPLCKAGQPVIKPGSRTKTK